MPRSRGFSRIPPAGRLLFAGVLLGLGACAAIPRVDVARDPQARFDRYDTFTFHQPLGTDREDGTVTILSQALRQAARAELESLGYRYVDGAADLEVNFFVETREVLESRRPSIGVSYGVFHRNYGVWADYGTDLRQVTEGSLHVDVVDVEREQLVWEAVVRERLVDSGFVFDPEEVEQAVSQAFARFPRRLEPLE
jgi:hypothetical protein